MAKKRGTFSLSGVGTKMEQHAERVLKLVKLNSHEAGGLAYASLLLLEQRDSEKFKTLMTEATIAALYDQFDTRRKAREQARSDASAGGRADSAGSETRSSERRTKATETRTQRRRHAARATYRSSETTLVGSVGEQS